MSNELKPEKEGCDIKKNYFHVYVHKTIKMTTTQLLHFVNIKTDSKIIGLSVRLINGIFRNIYLCPGYKKSDLFAKQLSLLILPSDGSLKDN